MSTEAQLQGDSLRRQIELSRSYAREHDLTLVEEFRLQDLGVSAFKGANVHTGALGRFLAAVENAEVEKGSYLLVESLDRLSRQAPQYALQLFLKILHAGVNIVTLSDRRTYAGGLVNSNDLLMSLLIMTRAHEESEMKSARLSAAWKQKRKTIGSTKLTGRCPGWMRLSSNRRAFELLPERVVIVHRIFNDAASGMGSFAITRSLNRQGVECLGRARRWNVSYVTKILTGRAVLGEFQPHSKSRGRRIPVGDPIVDYFPRIIDHALFDRVQSLRLARSNGGGGRKGSHLSNLFSRVAKCGYCGGSMRYVDKGRGTKGGQYLICVNALQGSGCVRTGWEYRTFERFFLKLTREVDVDAILRASEVQLDRRSRQVRLAELTELDKLLKERREKTYRLLDSQSTEFIATRLKGLEEDLARTAAEIRLVSSSPRTTNRAKFHWMAHFNAAESFVDSANAFERQQVAQAVSQMVRSLRLFVGGLDRLGPNSRPAFEVEFVDGKRRKVELSDTISFLISPEGQSEK